MTRVTSRPAHGMTVVACEGRLDWRAIAALKGAGGMEGPGAVVLDLSAVVAIDSAGIGAVVACHRRLAGRLAVAAPPEAVRKALSLARIDALLDVYDSVSDAAWGLRIDGSWPRKETR